MSARLINSLGTTGPMAELFSDTSVLKALLEFEASLARVEARLGVIPKDAAKAIVASARPELFDAAELAEATFRAGTPGIPIAKTLTEVVRKKDARAAGFVHWGATSQDAADTALVLLLKKARPLLLDELARTEQSLRKLGEQHANTIMLGRTLLQPAPPVTFGLKAAGWVGAVQRGRQRLVAAFDSALVLQFGGASGTLASLGDKGIAVAQALAEELELHLPEAPWHTHRDRLAALMCACGVLTGSLGKIARDISLLMQNEVGEAAEPGGQGRGGSSTMPHKRNPIACALTLSAATRVPGLVASFLSAMLQEHERGVGGWQAEWPIVSSIVQATGVATASIAEVAQGLSVDANRMRANLEATNGAPFAEKAAMLLARKIGRDSAHELLKAAAGKVQQEGKDLVEVLSQIREVTAHLDANVLSDLQIPEQYLGSAEMFRKTLLSAKPDSPQSTRRQNSVSRRTRKER